MPKLIVTRHLPQGVEKILSESFAARLNPSDRPFTREELVAAVKEADILIPSIADRLDGEVLAQAQPLKLIANFGVGTDHIDLKAAAARGIRVSNTPGVLTKDTADLAFALLLDAARRLGEGERHTRTGNWGGWTPTFMLGTRVSDKKLGIIGMGRIGQAVAQRARGFGMEIHYHNRKALPVEIEQSLGATYWPDLDKMLPELDFLSLNCPKTPETVGLLSASRLALLRKEAIVVNTARGDVIDEEALALALAEKRIAAAGLDVYAREPQITARLLDLDNVVLAPHLGSATLEGRTEMGLKVIANIKAFLNGDALPDEVKA